MAKQRDCTFENGEDFSDANTGHLSSDFILSFDDIARNEN